MCSSDLSYLGIVLNYPEKSPGITPELRTTEIRQVSKRVSENTTGSLGVGFIGAGNFTKAVLFPVLKKQKDICLKTICTATGMNAGQTAEKQGFACATTDYKELLNDPEINTVFITTQHNNHAHFVKEAMEAGKHVFVEKPLCLTPEDLTDLRSVYNDSGQHLLVGFNRRFSPHAKLIKDYFKERRTPMMVNYRVNAGIIPPDEIGRAHV